MNRTEKATEVEILGQSVGQVAHAFLVDFKGLDVARSTDLRAKLRDKEGRLRIVKNRLAKLALAETPFAELESFLAGQTAIAYPIGEDVVGVAKVLRDFAKDHDLVPFKAGMVDGKTITAQEFDSLADLPSREALIAQVLYMMQYPITGFVTTLSGVLRNFVVVLEQIRQQKESE